MHGLAVRIPGFHPSGLIWETAHYFASSDMVGCFILRKGTKAVTVVLKGTMSRDFEIFSPSTNLLLN